jgi:hypothetical protein
VIKGDTWTFEVMTPRAYEKKHSEGSGAICMFDEKKIELKGEVDLGYLAHEMLHAEAYYLCLESATELTPGDVEEMFCTLMQRNLFKYHDMVLEVCAKLVGLENTQKMRDELCR